MKFFYHIWINRLNQQIKFRHFHKKYLGYHIRFFFYLGFLDKFSWLNYTAYLPEATTYRKSVEYKNIFTKIIIKGGDDLKVEINIDKTLDEEKIVIYAREMNKEILSLKESLENGKPNILTGFFDGRLEFIDPENIIRVYANDKKVYAVSQDKTYLLRLALYQVEQRLDPKKFVRISNSEIINLKKTKNFDLSYIGTISCQMVNGDVCYVSKRTLKKVKEILGI